MNWSQFQAILWLRWRLTQNRVRRAGVVNAVLSIIMAALVVVSAVGLAVGGVAGGWFAATRGSSQTLLWIWDGVFIAFCFVWFSGLMVEIQRSESIDLAKLLHLPITLRQVFVFNYAASHLTVSIVLFVPAMLGLVAGLAAGAGPRLALMLPVVLGGVFMVTAWTYCLRGWLAALMINKRRRRAVMVWITVLFVAVAQVPNLVIQTSVLRQAKNSRGRPPAGQPGQGGGFELSDTALNAHLFIPPGWAGYSAKALAEQNIWPALGAAAASWLIGAMGLMRAYAMTMRFYQGAEGGAHQAPAPVQGGGADPLRDLTERRRRRPMLVDRQIPWLPDDVAGLALATLRSLLRAPELKMALIMPLVLGAVLGAMYFSHPGKLPGYFTPFAATLAAVVGVFSIASTLSNAFGLDRDGFRALMLLPTRRHHILLAKNLAFFPYAGGTAVMMLVLGKCVVGISWGAFMSGLLQAPTAYLLFCLCGNLLAILTPYRLAPGTLQAKKPKAVVFVAAILAMTLMPLILAPLLIAPGLELLFSAEGWLPWLPVNFLGSLALLGIVSWVYWALLPSEGRLLQRREQAILMEVTEEVE